MVYGATEIKSKREIWQINLHEYTDKVERNEKIKKRDIVLEFIGNDIYEYLNDSNISEKVLNTLDNICLIEIDMKSIKDYNIRNVWWFKEK